MSFILNIDTAVAGASVCLAQDAVPIGLKANSEQTESAAWVHTAIQELLKEQNIALHQLSAVAVSAGPGSYTGLRIGMATAKGLCYVLRIPLIQIHTLQMMASSAIQEPTELLCPMIDARRMEVFTAVYNTRLNEVMPAQPLILQPGSFQDFLDNATLTFFGNGSAKFHPLMQHPHGFFKNITTDASHMTRLAYQAFSEKKFADLAYSEPFYGKAFYSPAVKH